MKTGFFMGTGVNIIAIAFSLCSKRITRERELAVGARDIARIRVFQKYVVR